jgi:hypothetical protein
VISDWSKAPAVERCLAREADLKSHAIDEVKGARRGGDDINAVMERAFRN